MIVAARLSRKRSPELLIDAARQSGVGGDCRADWWATGTALAVEGGAASVAFDVHLEDGGVMDDVRITAGVHGGCIRLLGSKSAKIETLESLRGKAVGISDQASPAKNFVSIALMKKGIDPIKDIEWRQYPAEVLLRAVDKAEVDAIADNDPRTYLWLKGGTVYRSVANLALLCQTLVHRPVSECKSQIKTGHTRRKTQTPTPKSAYRLVKSR